MTDELTHHGVKGMRWGILRRKTSSGGIDTTGFTTFRGRIVSKTSLGKPIHSPEAVAAKQLEFDSRRERRSANFKKIINRLKTQKVSSFNPEHVARAKAISISALKIVGALTMVAAVNALHNKLEMRAASKWDWNPPNP